MDQQHAQAQLDAFIDKFTPEVAALTRALFDRMKARIPGAVIPVYDNYNALAIGFGATDRVKDVVLSLAVMPRWVTLCFMWGVHLSDPHRLLRGEGSQIRNLRLFEPEALDDPRIDALIEEALDQANVSIDPSAPHRLVIKSVSAKQRPRRPTGA
jgi:hypothetical protein